MSRHPVLESCWMLVAALSFSLMAGCMKVAADTFSIYEIIFYRSLLGVAIGYGVLRKTGISLHTTRPWTYVFRCSVGTFCILLGVWIVWRLPLGTAQTLAYTAALFFALFCIIEAFIKRQSVSWFLIGAIVCGFGGVLLILRPTVEVELMIPMLIGLLVGFTGALADFTVRKMTEKGEPPPRIVFYFVCSGTLVGGLGALMTTGFHALDWMSATVLFFVGLFGTLGQLAMTHAWKHGLPLLNTIFQYAGVIFAVILGVLAFGDEIDALTLAGIAVVCASGVAAGLANLKKKH